MSSIISIEAEEDLRYLKSNKEALKLAIKRASKNPLALKQLDTYIGSIEQSDRVGFEALNASSQIEVINFRNFHLRPGYLTFVDISLWLSQMSFALVKPQWGISHIKILCDNKIVRATYKPFQVKDSVVNSHININTQDNSDEFKLSRDFEKSNMVSKYIKVDIGETLDHDILAVRSESKTNTSISRSNSIDIDKSVLYVQEN